MIEFNEYQSRWMRERAPFHPTEQRKELQPGRLQIGMTVTALDGVTRFMMQYGLRARVVGPEELRDQIYAELSRNLKLFAELKAGTDQ